MLTTNIKRFVNKLLQSVHDNKSGFQVLITCLNPLTESINFLCISILSRNFKPNYDKLSSP